MGCLAVLSRFILCLSKRGLPLYQFLKKTDRFAWTPKAQEALDKVKEILMKAPILVPPDRWRVAPALHRGHYTSGQHCLGGRARGRGTCPQSAVPQKEATPLLRVTPDDGRDVLPSWQGHPKPRCHRKNHKVGTRANGSGHYVCLSDSHQVLGVG